MANLRYSADLLDDILFRAGEPTDGTSDFNAQALIDLNRAYRAVWMGGGEFVKEMNEPWLWLKKSTPGILTLQPYDEVGTISVTNNSTSATLSATRSTDLDGWFLKITGHPDVFRISAHTAGSAALTLDGVYTGATASAASFRLFKLEYDLAADLLRLIAPMRCYSENVSQIDGIDLVALDRDYPILYADAGTPDKFALVTDTKVRFNKYGGTTSTDLRRVEYDYHYRPDDLTDSGAEEPVVPREHRQVLADCALFYLLTTKSDVKAEGIGAQAKAGLMAMAADNRKKLSQLGEGMGRIYPRLDYTRRNSRVLRTAGGLIIG
jgi:hypothetical protein